VAKRQEAAAREKRCSRLVQALLVIGELCPISIEELQADPNLAQVPSAAELVASILPNDLDSVAESLAQARDFLPALDEALQERRAALAAR
jgi:hypothetical protein